MTNDDLLHVVEWFERHREDRCRCQKGPPDMWAEYMLTLLTALGAAPIDRTMPELEETRS